MKDYYYILGVLQSSTTEDVKKAYRKLSLKFHPDKNDGDEFFVDRFNEIQEAYETLTDISKRRTYDEIRNNESSKHSNYSGINFTPEIVYFKSNKELFEYDEEITFSWKTINSDKVYLKPFGLVQPIGQKTYKIKDFRNPSLTFELVSKNSTIDREIKSSLTLSNKTYKDLYSYFKEKIRKDEQNNYQSSSQAQKKNEKNTKNGTIKLDDESIEYHLIRESKDYDFVWGKYITYKIRILAADSYRVYKGNMTGKYFYFDKTLGKVYCNNFENAVYRVYLHNK